MSDRPVQGPAERAKDAAYREFMEPGAMPEGARVAEAEAQLCAMLERELGVPIAEDEEDHAARNVPARALPSRSRRSTTMWALAATVAVMAGVSWIALSTRPREERLLRGTTPPPVSGAWDARPQIEATAASGARLSWRPAPGADSYAIVFLAADLSERARVAKLADLEFALTPETRPEGFAAGEQGLWRVHAYAGADEIGRSPAIAITFP